MRIYVLHSGDLDERDANFIRDRAVWRNLFRHSGHEVVDFDSCVAENILDKREWCIKNSDVVFVICDERGTSLAGRYFDLATRELKLVSLLVHESLRDSQGELEMREKRQSLRFANLACIDYYSSDQSSENSLASYLRAGLILYEMREKLGKKLSSVP